MLPLHCDSPLLSSFLRVSGALLLVSAAASAGAHPHPPALGQTPGTLVTAAIEIDEAPAPLYAAPDGSGRFYFEAVEGRPYGIVLSNRSAERLGVAVAVDGLDVISGTRHAGRARMYVLAPGQSTRIRGWRTSLADVRTFTFVDERASYASRSGQANRKMGWIELAVHRERRASADVSLDWRRAPSAEPEERGEPYGARSREDSDGNLPERKREARAGAAAEAPAPGAAARSYPGTGWGEHREDRARMVAFDAEPAAAETITLRYEYRSALVALGVLPRQRRADRLQQRDRADAGFAQPPLF